MAKLLIFLLASFALWGQYAPGGGGGPASATVLNATCSNTANGTICFDTTKVNFIGGYNGAGLAIMAALGAVADGDCAKFSVVGTTVRVTSNGSGCSGASISGQITGQALKATSTTASTASMNLKEETAGQDSFLKAAAFAGCPAVTYNNAGTSTIDLSLANCYSLTIPTSGTTTLAVSNAPSGGADFWLALVQDATTAGSVTYPVSFVNGGAPSLGLSSTCYQHFFFNSLTSKYEGGSQSCTDAAGVLQTSEAAAPTTATYCGTGKLCLYGDSTSHAPTAKQNNGGTAFVMPLIKASRTGNQFVTNIDSTGTQNVAPIAAADVPAVLATVGSSRSIANNAEIIICTTTCTVTPPATGSTVAGMQFCAQNDDNVSTVITIAAVTSVQYENTARTSYKTAATAIASAGAVKDQICFVARDATHWNVFSATGTWN